MTNIVKLNENESYDLSGNKNLVAVDDHILICELVGSLNRHSSWGNRQAETASLNAYFRAKVRTSIGQAAVKVPQIHLQETRSGYGELYSWESNFAPHALGVITEDKFMKWVSQLDAKKTTLSNNMQKVSLLPSQFEACIFVRHVVWQMLQSYVPKESNSFKVREAFEQKMDKLLPTIGASNFNIIASLVELAKELSQFPKSDFGVAGYPKEA